MQPLGRPAETEATKTCIFTLAIDKFALCTVSKLEGKTGPKSKVLYMPVQTCSEWLRSGQRHDEQLKRHTQGVDTLWTFAEAYL